MGEKLFWENFKENLRKLIPDLFTLGNLALGVTALFYLLEGRGDFSISFIFIAMVLDGLDGKLAVKLNTVSERGKQLDSLCDLVSFGVAPAAVFYTLSLYVFGNLGFLVALLFPLAGAWRLARFNLLSASEKEDFMGLPITIAGGALVALLLTGYFHLFWVPVPYILFLSFLMISKIPYPAVKKKNKNRHESKVTGAGGYSFLFFYLGIIAFALLILLRRDWIFFLLSAYVWIGFIFGFYKTFRLWRKRKDVALPFTDRIDF